MLGVNQASLGKEEGSVHFFASPDFPSKIETTHTKLNIKQRHEILNKKLTGAFLRVADELKIDLMNCFVSLHKASSSQIQKFLEL